VTGWRHPNERLGAELPAELRRGGVPPAVRAWITRRCGAAVATARRLPGASSTAVHAIRLTDGRHLVLRRYVWDQFRNDEPDAPAREVAALEHVAGRHLPVPAVVAADVTGTEVGDGVPVVLMSRLPGRAQAAPDLDRLARLGAELHQVPTSGFVHRYVPWCRATSTRPPAGCRRPDRWERALRIWHTGEPPYQPRFIHRDFHPGNVLWQRGRLTGLVDWANACVGPPGIDVATCRRNLAAWATPDAADAYVAAVDRVSGVAHHPYWDIAGVLEDDWDLIDDPRRIVPAEDFLGRALDRWDRVG
jgi:aminoglycoside phosphotransferase (APT) family kinase protein